MIYLFLLLSAANYKAQADALLDYAVAEAAELRDWRLASDSEGGLWIASNNGGDLYISRITPEGKPGFESVLIEDTLDVRLENQIAFDRRGNAWLVSQVENQILPDEPGVTDTITPLKPGEGSLASLARVTPGGEVKIFATWPELSPIRNYVAALPGDTLLIIGVGGTNSAWVSKWLITEQGLSPAGELDYYYGPHALFSASSSGSQRDYSQNFLDWSKGTGLRAEIYWFHSYEDRGPDKLNLYHLSLRPEDNFSFKNLGVFNWRNYVWRTCKDTWIRYMTFSSSSDGGWVLAIPDPDDRSLTHLVRLSEQGIPLNPDSLKLGGGRQPRSIKRLPGRTLPQFDLAIWRGKGQKPDSARVLIWSMDAEGNLYAFRKIRKY